MNYQNNIFNKLFFVIFGFIFFIAINYLALSQQGIAGLQSPQNGVVWMGIAGLIALAFFKIIFTSSINVSKLTSPLFLTLCLMLGPGLISTDALIRDVVLRVAQVLGFFLLFISLLQFNFTKLKINHLLYLIIFSAIVQIIYAVAQIHHNPDITPSFLLFYLGENRPPVGGFLQVNTLSIFFVTSIVISFYLFLQASFKNDNILKKISLVVTILGGSYLIAVVNSLAALVALVTCLILLLLSQVGAKNSLKDKKHWGIAFLFTLIAGFSTGLENNGKKDVLKHNTNARTYVWNLSYQAIKDKPFLGHGVGNFSKAFYDQNERHNSLLPENERIKMGFFSHPHNELFYWGVESGVLAVLAILAFMVFYLVLLLKKGWRYALKYLALLFPIAFHTQVSYPFYLSPILMVLFLFLLVTPFKNEEKVKSIAISETVQKISIVLITVVFGLYIWFVKETIQSGINFTYFVQTGANNNALLSKAFTSPYWNKEESIMFNFLKIQQEYKQGNIKSARSYLNWFEKQIERDENPKYYSALLSGYKLFGEKENYKKINKKQQLRY